MNQPDLIQSKLFHKVELTLEGDGILVNEKNLTRSNKTYVEYENIPPKPSELTMGSKRSLIGALLFSVVTLVCLPLAFSKNADWSAPVIWGIVAAIFWGSFFISRKTLIRFVQNGGGLNIYKNNPSDQAVNDFIKKMFGFRKTYLIKRYGRILDAESLESKIGRLNYLRDQEVISDEEFESRREKFIKGSPNASGPIGFAPQ